MPIFQTSKKWFLCILIMASLGACGGSGDDDVVPKGNEIANVSFADSDSYYPLDKLRANGSYFEENDSAYGIRNPKHQNGDKTTSIWAIDTSASTESGRAIRYRMKIEAVNAENSAVNSLRTNLTIDSTNGLISQTCAGFPHCHDNTTAYDEEFMISAIAQVEGSSKALTRTFVLKVVRNN